MKTFTSISLALALGASALPTLAGDLDNEQLAQCKTELQGIYGDDARMKLKSMKRSRVGNKMRIQAIPTEGDSATVTCWVDQQGAVNLVDRDGVALVAPELDTGDKVSQAN